VLSPNADRCNPKNSIIAYAQKEGITAKSGRNPSGVINRKRQLNRKERRTQSEREGHFSVLIDKAVLCDLCVLCGQFSSGRLPEKCPNSNAGKYGIELMYLTKESYEAKKKQITDQQKNEAAGRIGGPGEVNPSLNGVSGTHSYNLLPSRRRNKVKCANVRN
jgi:hypothetical protein